MKTTAKVEILQQRIVERDFIIEVEVEIKGITKRKTYILSRDSTDQEIQEYISDKIIKEEKRNVGTIGTKFEVELE